MNSVNEVIIDFFKRKNIFYQLTQILLKNE